MLTGSAKRIFNKGPAGPAGATLASALQDVVAPIKAVLTAADLPTARAAFGLTIGSAVQAWSATLDALAGLATTAFGRSLLGQADAPTALGTLGAVSTARQIVAGTGLSGGGDLTADRTIAIATNGVTNALLAQTPAGTVKANLLGSTANVTDATFAQLLDAMLGTTRGSLAYRGSTGWTPLAPGSVGQYLGAGGVGADPSWGTPAGAGNVSTSGSPTAGLFALFASGTAIKGVAAPSFRNRIINGNFAINQRGAASASTAYAAGAYVMDRWKAGASGCTLSFAAAANGDVTVTITAGTLVQVIEGGLYLPEGGAFVLSWTGTATARVYQGAATGAYAASPIAASGLTAGTNTTVEISTGTIGLAQFEPGATPTAFERRDDEKRRCERYYETSQCDIYFNAYSAGANESEQVRMTEKRITPQVSVSGISASNANPPSITVLNTKEIMFSVSSTSQALARYLFNYFASAEL